MSTRLQITKALMDMLDELVTADSYVSSNSIPVIQWTEAGTDVVQRFVLVGASQSQQLFADSECFSIDVALHAMTYMGDDQSRTANNALFDRLAGLMVNLTPAACNATTARTGTDITIDGIINCVQSDAIEENYWQQSIQATFFLSYDRPPINSVLPAITGTTEVGETLTCSTGTWTNASSYAYQWRRDGENITAATSATYELVADDEGSDIDCVVTATHTTATATATAAAVVPIGGLWTPAQISPVAWLDGSNSSTLTAIGSDLSGVDDLSGNSNHATQADGAKQPLTGGSIGGLNAITGGGSRENWMSVANTPNAIACYAVAKVTSLNAKSILTFGGNKLVPFGTEPTHEFFITAAGAISFDGLGSGTGKYSINGAAYSGFSNSHVGVSVVAGTPFQISGVYDSIQPLVTFMCRPGSIFTELTTGEQIGEMIWTAAELSTADRQKMEGYLAWKWGLEDDLPVDHPYKSAAPTV